MAVFCCSCSSQQEVTEEVSEKTPEAKEQETVSKPEADDSDKKADDDSEKPMTETKSDGNEENNSEKEETVSNSGNDAGKDSSKKTDEDKTEEKKTDTEEEKETKEKNPVTESEEKDSDSKAKDFDSIISDNFSDFGGNLSYSLHMYGSGYTTSKNRDQSMKSASVIKLFIMEYAYERMSKGEITPDTVIGNRKLSSLIESMITVSDNEATNILIDYFTVSELNEYFGAQGYGHTKLQRKMLDFQAAQNGKENYTSAGDVMLFLDRLYENKNSYPQKEMLDIMKRQQISTKLRRKMPSGIKMASKTGELSDTENDVAIVFTPNGDYAIVCLTGGGSPSMARDAMANCCREIYDMLQQN